MAVTKDYVNGLDLKRGESVAIREGEKIYYGHYHIHTENHIHMFYDTIPAELTRGHGPSYAHRLNEIDDVFPITKDIRRIASASDL